MKLVVLKYKKLTMQKENKFHSPWLDKSIILEYQDKVVEGLESDTIKKINIKGQNPLHLVL